jgi:hypothetical protein
VHILPAIKRLPRALFLSLIVFSVSSCELKKSMRCAFTDITHDVQSGNAETRGLALECALSENASEIAPLVPLLLPLFSDATVYRRYYSGGGLIGFGEAGERELVVAQMAIRAVQKAQPIEANIKPLIQTLVKTANIMRSSEYAGLYGDPKTSVVILIQLLEHEFHDAGFGSQVAIELRKQLPQIKNPIFTNDKDLMRSLSALAEGEVYDPYAHLVDPNASSK